MSYRPPGEPPDPNQPYQPYDQQPGEPGQYGQQPGQYGQPGSGFPSGQEPGRLASTNVMAILSLVFAFLFAPAGIVLGHLARKQIAQTGEQGSGLAKAGLILSYIFTGFGLLGCCAWVVLIFWAGSDSGTY